MKHMDAQFRPEKKIRRRDNIQIQNFGRRNKRYKDLQIKYLQ